MTVECCFIENMYYILKRITLNRPNNKMMRDTLIKMFALVYLYFIKFC